MWIKSVNQLFPSSLREEEEIILLAGGVKIGNSDSQQWGLLHIRVNAQEGLEDLI